MGFDIAGLIIQKKISDTETDTLLEKKMEYLEDVNFEAATSSFKDDDIVDILQSDTGTLIITGLGQMYDLPTFPGDIIQFMISGVSDTYYFEKYTAGQLVRKYITSQGATAEDTGEGFITEGDDLAGKVWAFADAYLQNGFMENMFDMKFKRYQLK